MLWWGLLALGALVLGHGSLPLSAGLFAGAGVVLYVISLALHPFRTCRSCNGTGRHRGTMFPWSHRACARCGGGSRHRRWGAQYLYGAPGRQTRAERDAKQAGARRGAPR